MVHPIVTAGGLPFHDLLYSAAYVAHLDDANANDGPPGSALSLMHRRQDR